MGYFFYPDRGAEYCDKRACLSPSVYVCLSAIISPELHVRSTRNVCACYTDYGRGSVLLRRRSDTLCRPTSGFVHDVIFAHKPRLLCRRPTGAQCTRSLGLGYKLCAVIPVAGRRTYGATFLALKVTSQVATPGAESGVYDCLVY